MNSSEWWHPDYTVFIRELYPKETLEEVIGKGDKVYLNPYLDDFQNKFYHYNMPSA